jgi:DNA-binding transcriptional LysR family regulator
MDVTIPQLRMLIAVADNGTIAAAAAALGYTPSAVSQQMTGLSQLVGSPVLERVGRNVRITDVGRTLVDRAGAILAELEAAQSAVEQLRSDVAGLVRIGYVESMTASIIVPLVCALGERHPDLALQTFEQGPDVGPVEVQAGRLDVAVLIDDGKTPIVESQSLQIEPVLTEHMRLVVPADSAIAGPRLDLAELAEVGFVSSSSTLLCGRLAAEACRRAGFEPRVDHHVDLYPTTLQLVAAGVGVALVPDLAIGIACPPGIRVIDPIEPVTRRVSMVWRTSSRDRPAVAAVLDEMRRLFASRSQPVSC